MSQEFINTSTGEIVEIAMYRTPQQMEIGRKVKHTKIVNNQSKRDFECMAGRNFSFFKQSYIKQYLSSMNDTYLKAFGAVIVLSSYLPMDGTNKLPFKTMDDFAKALKLSRVNATENVKLAQELNLIYKIGNDYMLNDDVIFRGKNGNVTETVKAYHKTINAVAESMSMVEIGFLFLILPFISFDNHVVCHNPEASKLEDIVGMSLTELAAITNMNKSTISRKFKSMTFTMEGITMAVFSYFKNPVSGKQLIVVNPALFVRSTSDSWRDLVKLFVISR